MPQGKPFVMAEPPKVIPLEAAQVLLAGGGQETINEFPHPPDVSDFPALLSQDHVLPVKQSAITEDLLLSAVALFDGNDNENRHDHENYERDGGGAQQTATVCRSLAPQLGVGHALDNPLSVE